MADLTARIKPKKSSTTGEVPQAADLEVAELAVNTADGKLFVKHTDDSIKEISGGGGGSTPIARFARYTWDADGATSTPASGVFNLWTGSTYACHTTDNRGADFFDNILAESGNTINIVVRSGGEIVYNGTMTTISNVNSSRFTFGFGSDAWTANLVDGCDVDFYAAPFDEVQYTASLGEVSTFDGTSSEPQTISTYNLRDVAVGHPGNGQILRFNGTSSQYESVYPTIQSSSDFGYAKALLGSYTYAGAGNASPVSGGTSDYTGSNWAVNVVDNLGVDHETALYAQTLTTNLDVYVDGVFQVTTTAANWGNKNGSRCTFLLGDDSWKAGLSGGELIEFYGEPFTLTDVAPVNGQALTWVDANSRWEPAGGSAVRALLGIGEYVDDAAAGTGGVASGAMYYNTTSSDYRLKS